MPPQRPMPYTDSTPWFLRVDPRDHPERRNIAQRPIIRGNKKIYGTSYNPQPYPMQWTNRGDWIDRAGQFVGLHEWRNNKELKELLHCDPARTPWCADFVNSVLGKSGIKGSGSMLARDFSNWGVPVRRVPGAIASTQGHSSIVADGTSDIGGNLTDMVRKHGFYINDPDTIHRYPSGYPIPRTRPTVDEIHRSQFNLPEPHLTNMRLGVARTLADNLMQRLQ